MSVDHCSHCGARLPRKGKTAAASIIAAVRHVTGISAAKMRSKKRDRATAYARHAAIYLTRELTDRSWPEIGDLFRRDHSTAINAYRETEICTDRTAIVMQARVRLKEMGVL